MSKGKSIIEDPISFEIGETSSKEQNDFKRNEEILSLTDKIFGNKKWGDISPSSSEKDDSESDTGSSTSESDINENNIVINEGLLENLSTLGNNKCSCLIFSNTKECLSSLFEMLELTPSFNDIYCTLNNIVNSYNYIFQKHNSPYSKYRVAFADLFYRIRHEILFKILCLFLNLDPNKSDIPFSNFGIESNRTPDKIVEINGATIILEVTAVSSYEKAAISKGMETMGFESKYKKEIELLKDIKENVIYLPLFFNMSDINNPIHPDQLHDINENFNVNKNYLGLLNQTAKNFSHLSISFKDHLTLPSSILFSDPVEIIPNHPDHIFLYKLGKEKSLNKKGYSELTVSNLVFKKIHDVWDRLINIVERKGFPDNQKIRIILDSSSHRIDIEKDRNGLNSHELDYALSTNDKVMIFKNTYLKLGKATIKCTESDSGVKFIESTSSLKDIEKKWIKIEEFGSHPNKITKKVSHQIDLIKYQEKCRCFKSSNIICNYYDSNYENVILNSIIQFDKNNKAGNMKQIDFGTKLLGQMALIPESVIAEMNMIKISYNNLNSENEGIPRTILKCKSPFVLPMGDFNSTSYCKLEYKNEDLIQTILEVCGENNNYTKSILSGIQKQSYNMYTERKVVNDSLQSLINQRMDLNNEMNRLFKQSKKENPNLKRMKDIKNGDKKIFFEEISKKISSINKAIKKKNEIEGYGKDISYLRLPTKNKNSLYHISYKEEMEHFKTKKIQSTTEGVGIIESIESDYKKDCEVFRLIHDVMMEYRGENPDKLYDNFVSDDSQLLFDLKKSGVELYKNSKKEFENSALGHSCSFISRLGHSLMFYSQQSFSSDYVRVDNLGYKNVFLIVKGGKKIFKSKSSKQFRLIIPISKVLISWYKCNHFRKGSSIIFEHKGEPHLMTPWAFLHENTLSDSISFYQRVGSFTILNLKPEVSLKLQFHKVQLNVMLAFHNRRQTEVLLANLRYILLSTMGEYTGLQEILKEFFGFNYDCFQSFIRSCILYNYPTYFNSLYEIRVLGSSKEISESSVKNSDLKNIFTGNKIENIEDLAIMIYSTFLMTKAPYQKLVERANNLKGILKIHDYYAKNVGLQLTPKEQLDKLNVTCDDDYIKYSKKLFSNDFNFDAKYCALIGNFMDSYFKNNVEKDIFHSEWIKIQNSNWDEMATSTGLRGDYETTEDFWGKKGYFVVYKSLLKDPDFKNSLFILLNDSLTDNEKRKILRSMNKIYKESERDNEFLIFHAVDKTQWRGGREIYVMDIHTKILQQPIEKFMGFVCSKMDNELISIPSNKRAQVIHHSIFEKDLPLKEMMTWYLTLDCSKWAPKSIFAKFSICLNNMSTIPNSFKIHLLNYFEKLYKKRLYFNEKEVEVLSSNPVYFEVCKNFLKKDDKVKGYYLEANYTWVMGIFNYMSSFLHAANQKYFSYLLSKSTQHSYGEDCTLTMFAHSDDSGGRITVSSPDLLTRALILYEINLHAANHLISKKKSVVSKIYFEILSVIYLFKKLLALLPKFLGGLRFLPTDKGPSQDLLQSYSKCIEVIIAGADFSISYIVLKIMSYLIYRFYFNKSPEPIDYLRPGQYAGMPDAHPIMCLLCGTDADILRLMKDESSEGYLKNQIAFVNSIIENSDGEGPIKPLKFIVNIKNLNKDFGVYLEFFSKWLESWSIKNVNYHSTGMNTLGFLSKLKDPGFIGSLVNESQVRRISRSYYYRNSESMITNYGNMRLSHFIDGIKIYNSLSEKNEVISDIFLKTLTKEENVRLEQDMKENFSKSSLQLEILKKTLKSPLKLLKYFDRLSLSNRNIISSSRTLKPALVQLNKGGKVFSVDFDPSTLISYIKEPDLRWALNNVKNINTAKVELERYLGTFEKNTEDLAPDLLLRICRSFGRDNVKNIYIYSRTPGDMRQIKNYTSFLTFLSVNSYTGKEIEGLTINVSDKDSSKEYVTSNVSETSYLINNIISVIMLFIKKCGLEFVISSRVNEIEELEYPGGEMLSFVEYLGLLLEDSIEGSYCLLQYYILKGMVRGLGYHVEDYKRCSYYVFTKEQKAKSGWYGLGEVYIYICGNFYNFKLRHNNAIELSTNKIGKLDQMHEKFILDVFDNIGVTLPKTKPKFSELRNNVFGYDLSGGLGIFSNKEVNRGVPCVYKESIGGTFIQIENSRIISLYKNYIFVKNQNFNNTFKIYFLPLKKVEIVDTVRRIFEPLSFKQKMEIEGLGDFEDYIMTEIMPDYGADLFIPFDQFIDNFSASKIYEIIKKCSDEGISKIKSDIEFSNVPAQEGSLMRILIDYSNHTGDNIVKTFNRIDSDVMRLRSEYPEQVSTILQEKLIDNYNNMYSKKEIKEITDSYMKIMCSNDINFKRQELIKMMCYWGFSSLVNNIEHFHLIKKPENYIYFNYRNCFTRNKEIYSNMYPTILNKIIELMKKNISNLDPGSYPVKELVGLVEPKYFLENCVKDICNNSYLSKGFMYNDSLNSIFFNNMFLNLMFDEDFIVGLQEIMNENSILCSLPIGYKYRNDILALLNTLQYVWYKQNNTEFQLNFQVRLQRLPDNIPTPSSKAKMFNTSLNSGQVYYHGFLNESILDWITTNKTINIKEGVYKIENKIKKISKNKVPINSVIQPERPINPEIFDTEDWEEIIMECNSVDLDEDTILDYWQNIKNKYQKKKTKITHNSVNNKKIVIAEISWIVMPYRVNSYSILNNLRQCGENIVILTNTQIRGFVSLKNSGCRLLRVGKMGEPILAYHLFQQELNDDKFINQILGPHKFIYTEEMRRRLLTNCIRDSDGQIKWVCEMGEKNTIEIMTGIKVEAENDETTVFLSPEALKNNEELNIVDNKTNKEENIHNKKMEDLKLLNERWDLESKKLGLSKDTIERVRNKYYDQIAKGLSMKVIFNSLITFCDLSAIKNSIISGDIDLSRVQRSNIMQNPLHFSGVSGGNISLQNPIKNKKLKSEMDSVSEESSLLVPSSRLTISPKMQKLVNSNYKMWISYAKNSSFKTENKIFMLHYFIMLARGAKPDNDTDCDNYWQTCINNYTNYMSQDEPDPEDELSDMFKRLLLVEPGARIKYRAKGVFNN